MSVIRRPTSRQALLFPKAPGNEELGPASATPELIDALADLLLEALGEECGEEGGARESEDHR